MTINFGPEAPKSTAETNLVDSPENMNALIEQNDVKGIRKMLHRSPSVAHMEMENGWTPYERAHTATEEILLEFLMADIDIHWTDAQGRNLARFCAEDDCHENLLTLAQHGIDVDLKDEKGNTPLDSALYGNHPEAAGILLSLGCTYRQEHLKRLASTTGIPTAEACLRLLRANQAHQHAMAAIADCAASLSPRPSP